MTVQKELWESFHRRCKAIKVDNDKSECDITCVAGPGEICDTCFLLWRGLRPERFNNSKPPNHGPLKDNFT